MSVLFPQTSWYGEPPALVVLHRHISDRWAASWMEGYWPTTRRWTPCQKSTNTTKPLKPRLVTHRMGFVFHYYANSCFQIPFASDYFSFLSLKSFLSPLRAVRRKQRSLVWSCPSVQVETSASFNLNFSFFLKWSHKKIQLKNKGETKMESFCPSVCPCSLAHLQVNPHRWQWALWTFSVPPTLLNWPSPSSEPKSWARCWWTVWVRMFSLNGLEKKGKFPVFQIFFSLDLAGVSEQYTCRWCQLCTQYFIKFRKKKSNSFLLPLSFLHLLHHST